MYPPSIVTGAATPSPYSRLSPQVSPKSASATQAMVFTQPLAAAKVHANTFPSVADEHRKHRTMDYAYARLLGQRLGATVSAAWLLSLREPPRASCFEAKPRWRAPTKSDDALKPKPKELSRERRRELRRLERKEIARFLEESARRASVPTMKRSPSRPQTRRAKHPAPWRAPSKFVAPQLSSPSGDRLYKKRPQLPDVPTDAVDSVAKRRRDGHLRMRRGT